MDEVGFGPSREPRPPSRRLRALAAVSAAGVALAGVALALALQANGAQPAVTTRPAATRSVALPDPARLLPPAGCPPVQAHWPNLAGLPAGMRAAALPVIVAAQFSGRCPGTLTR